MFDPLKTAEITQSIVCSGDQRKYYRFWPAKFYGAWQLLAVRVATCGAPSAGHCDRLPGNSRILLRPMDVVRSLISIAKGRRLTRLKISGSEPTLFREHLIKVLELIPEEYLFILETNGILIGQD